MIINKFGTQAVRSAWYDSKQVSDDVLQGYTKVSSTWYSFSNTWMIVSFFSILSKAHLFSNWQPLRVKGWDKALVEFTVAMLAESNTKSKDKRLSEISCPGLDTTPLLACLICTYPKH